jgi:hypothetical protein
MFNHDVLKHFVEKNVSTSKMKSFYTWESIHRKTDSLIVHILDIIYGKQKRYFDAIMLSIQRYKSTDSEQHIVRVAIS